MKKIYPKEWLKLHPYNRTDSVDQYYTGIANEICTTISLSSLYDAFRCDEDIRHTSLCLAAWFEDIISQTGIWPTFTAECKKRHGSYLPFYTINDDYFPDEINLEDIRFLLWHHIQYHKREHNIINPEYPGIEEAAQDIYQLLADEYETAPENERMQKCLCHSSMGEEDFFDYRELLEWFHYYCYFNIENNGQFFEETTEMLGDKEVSPKHYKSLLYSTHTTLMFAGRRNLLSLTSPEWLALIAKNHSENKVWSSVKFLKNSCYLLENEDQEYLYFKDLCGLVDDENDLLRVKKKSLRLTTIKQREVGRSSFMCELVYFGNAWWQSGLLIENKFDERIAQYVEELKKENAKEKEKAVYSDFMKASGGKFGVFCKSKEEISDFLHNKMGYTNTEDVEMPDIDIENGALITATPHIGLHIQYRLCECIKSPDNSFYNQEEAEKTAFMFIVSPSFVPYQVSCLLQDHGTLPDACFNGLKSKEQEKEFMQKNAHFLTGYFFYQCREKDYDIE